MTWLGNFYRSAIGKKAVMAVTGVILFGWIFLHMVGNLKVYFGPEHFNEYALFLKTMLTPAVPETGMLWLSRIVLLVAVIFHIHSAYALTMMNREARPVGYRNRAYAKASYASRTMRWGGIIILLFVIYHILHFTTGQAHHDFVRDDPYRNFVTGFRIWWVSAIYIVANLALGLHLYHGVWSMFSSLGVTHKRFENWRRMFATAFAVIVTAGNVLFPLSVLLGIVR
ncbi:MAG TPA: succinate dehydrogenase cytochrome b subunit [Thermoanaerobaculia bacterium]